MRIPLSSPSLSSREKELVMEAIESGWISGTGSYVRDFEKAIAARIQRRHVVAVSNGTVAVELALRGLGIGPGDEVIVPALTFVTPAAMVCAVGATPVFADVEEATWTIDPDFVANVITQKTRAILTVDLLGHPCDYDRLAGFGIPIIEDAAQAHGASYRGRPVGSFGRVSTFSFHANKTIATGEGGCVATDDPELHEHLRLLANHGMTPERPYWHTVVGHNFRMTNVTAAIGLGQVERWDELVAARKKLAAQYDDKLGGLDIGRRPIARWAEEVCWLYTVHHPQREQLLKHLRAEGIDARGIWPDLPALPPYNKFKGSPCPVAREVSRNAMWLPTYAEMDEKIVAEVADTLKEALRNL